MEPSLSVLLQNSAERYAEQPAVLHEGGTTSYARLAADVERLAGLLHGLGLAETRIGILLPNLPVFPLVFHGAQRAACSTLLLNPVNSPRETGEYLLDAGVRAVLTTTALLGLLPLGTRALLVDDLPEILRLADESEDAPLRLADAPPAPDMPAGGDREAAVLYTAANRGWARGAKLSHRNLVANLRSTAEALRLTRDDVSVAALPLIHAFGLTVSLDSPLSVGACILPVERFHPARVLETLEEAGPTVLSGVPAMYAGLLAAGERRGVPAHRLRVALCGGAPLPVEISRRWEEVFGLPLRQGYGLTEAAPVCLFNRPDRPNHPGSLGYPLPGVQVSVRDLTGDPLPAGEVGELCVRGDNVFSGYLGEDGRAPGDFHGEWLRTGDLASEHPNGTFCFRGVLKPMFTRNGFNVYPRELERVLEDDPRVERASVCSLPNPARENDIVLLVEPAPGAQLTEDEVRELCRTRLAAYKQPSRVEVVTG